MRFPILMLAWAGCTLPTSVIQVWDHTLIDADEDGTVEVLTIERTLLYTPNLTLHDPVTGAVRWSSPQLVGFHPVGLEAVATSGVVVAKSSLTGTARLVGLDAASGSLLWERDAPYDFVELLVHEGALLLLVKEPGSSRTQRLDPATGGAGWTAPGDAVSVGDALWIDAPGRGLVALDPNTGQPNTVAPAPLKISGVFPAGPVGTVGGNLVASRWDELSRWPSLGGPDAPHVLTRTPTHVIVKSSRGYGPTTVFGIPVGDGDRWSVDFDHAVSWDHAGARVPEVGRVVGIVVEPGGFKHRLVSIDGRSGAITGSEEGPIGAEWRRCGSALVGVANDRLIRVDRDTGAWTHALDMPGISPSGFDCIGDRLIFKGAKYLELFDLDAMSVVWVLPIQRT